jgi:hypothetical protein
MKIEPIDPPRELALWRALKWALALAIPIYVGLWGLWTVLP